jgi:Domain of unknown function (DUF1883)
VGRVRPESKIEMPKPAFRYTHYDISEQRAGTVIEITLSAVANVRLMTSGNFQRFTETLKHQFIGGVAKKSPIRLSIPENGHWHLVVDMEGHNGLAESSVKLIDKPTAPRMQKSAIG